MALSVASLSPVSSVSFVAPKQQAYSISNESAVSSAYRDSIKNTSTPQGVTGPAPVQYATRRYDVSSVNTLNANQKMTRAYNNIASTFGGANTSYNSQSVASSYDMVGMGFDMFA